MARRPKYEKDENLIERLEKENRELKALSKSLQKRLKRVSKGYYRFLEEETEEDKEDAIQEVANEVKKLCWDCGGNYNKHKIMNRAYRACDGCGKRGKAKIIE